MEGLLLAHSAGVAQTVEHQVRVKAVEAEQSGKRNVTGIDDGASYSDGPDENGRVPDQRRLTYFKEHFQAAHRAIDNGVPLAGYFAWSLMDNFEWDHGYTQRFGLTWVDFETQERIFKDSGLWYKQVIQDNAV